MMEQEKTMTGPARVQSVSFGRRAVLGAGVGLGFCLCCLRPTLAAAPDWVFQEAAPGIFVRHGVDEDATAENQDAIANIGFVIGRRSVAVIDPGGCLEDGRRLRAAIRARTRLPVSHVIITHVHPDHGFGAGAFLDDHPVIVGHARLTAALAARGPFYRDKLDEILGKGRAGPVVMPTMPVRHTAEIDLGNRLLALTAHPKAHTDADLSVLDRSTGTLFTGDLLFVRRVPALDGSLKGWLGVLKTLPAIRPARMVPGHGPVDAASLTGWSAGVESLQLYLDTLLTETRKAIAENVPIGQAAHQVAVGQKDRWALFADYNGRNVEEAYHELEWE
ncbi:Beta-lactamase [Granulibacter bethesdensis]|uniref:Beta-lactamase n=2 Tax=Granulibacter bethesdensis TaxID=364410 RepID=A0AAN0VEP4_9PROT|nr:Beta-lactamase [Granulibacter bethesdensis]